MSAAHRLRELNESLAPDTSFASSLGTPAHVRVRSLRGGGTTPRTIPRDFASLNASSFSSFAATPNTSSRGSFVAPSPASVESFYSTRSRSTIGTRTPSTRTPRAQLLNDTNLAAPNDEDRRAREEHKRYNRGMEEIDKAVESSTKSFAQVLWESCVDPRDQHYVEEHRRLCLERKQQLERDIYQATFSSQSLPCEEKEAHEMHGQFSTWLLLHHIHAGLYEFDTETVPEQSRKLVEHFSHSAISRRVLKENPRLRVHFAVVRWLEDLASMSLSFPGKGPPMMKKTLRSLQTRSGHDNLVGSLDPDACSREGKEIESEDRALEDTLLKAVWQLVRAGKVEEAANLCRDWKQPWRAASISGGLLYQDGMNDAEPEQSSRGNLRRMLWKMTCRKLAGADGTTHGTHEKAVYGALGGDIGAVERVCNTWEDKCWAHFHQLAEQQLDTLLHEELKKYRTGVQHVAPLSQADLACPTFDAIFSKIRFSDDGGANNDDEYHVIQAAVIGHALSVAHLPIHEGTEPLRRVHHMDGLLTAFEKLWSSDRTPAFTRFLVHLYGYFHPECPAEAVHSTMHPCVKEYIAFLQKEEAFHNLVPLYTSLFHGSARINTYVNFLQNVASDDHRSELTQASIPFFAKDQMEVTRALAKGATDECASMEMDESHEMSRSRVVSPSPSSPLVVQLSVEDSWLASIVQPPAMVKEDHTHIRAILDLLPSSQFYDALCFGNKLMRNLVASNRWAAAEAFMARLHSHSLRAGVDSYLVSLQKQKNQGQEVDFVEEKIRRVQGQLFEFRCMRGLLALLPHFRDFHSEFTHPPQSPSAGVSFSARMVAQRQRDETTKEYQEQLSEWRMLVAGKVKQVQDMVHTVLRQDGGFLGAESCFVLEPDREADLILLREKCIPLLVHMVLRMYRDVQDYQSCVDVSALVVNSSHPLHQHFPKHLLQSFLLRLRTACILGGV